MLFVPLLILSTKPFGDGAMDDGGKLRIELAASVHALHVGGLGQMVAK